MPPDLETSPPAHDTARISVAREGERVLVVLGGVWSLRRATPPIPSELKHLGPQRESSTPLIITCRDLAGWDSSLVLFVDSLRTWADSRGMVCELRDLPAGVVDLLGKIVPTAAAPGPHAPRKLLTTRLGEQTHRVMDEAHAHLRFYGECVQAMVRIVLRPFAFRWADGFEQMWRCGAAALPIVGLISALVGVILAFVAAVQLRQFGADIFVADLVGLAVFREMGPMMAAIVLTGRTGAAFAAELGNMVLGEEVDALETFGVRSVDFLVAPRILALVLMMPLLAIYANFLGVVGGAIVAYSVLDIVPAAFFGQLQSAVGLGDLGTGLLKSVVFGWIVAYSGCFRGMRAGRSSVAVGEATTGAVVMGILLIIVSDAGFTVVFNILGW